MLTLPVVIKNITPEQVAIISQGLVAGVDEVGRGPLVGDVVTAAVILDPSNPIVGLNDSKKLSEKRRNALYQVIMENALCVSVGRASPVEIDQLNILHATMLAMQRAVAGLSLQPERVLVDGNRVPDFGIASHAIIKGDGLVAAISAASIIAKVTRDAEMDTLDSQHPQYGFAKHKGYPTKAHFEALALYGVLAEHRKSFKPVAQRILLQDTF
ncbi:MAG: ribonuclease HII [Shewanella psychromarinicola]|jgi:ribonuclease HII|uniref:ribonuclease HII n=1 Tax=Shewanella TaxID=22 RepID=UPI0013E38771|nr:MULTISPECIES: ribonuclease HII [Shewanella]MCL1082516.1 ribonuclease HII [Shewanella psychromarinicola]|tara:strand:+ start:59624 stop:60262 length:639 start_codon:yes stop_codon:yes gene_type:complete